MNLKKEIEEEGMEREEFYAFNEKITRMLKSQSVQNIHDVYRVFSRQFSKKKSVPEVNTRKAGIFCPCCNRKIGVCYLIRGDIESRFYLVGICPFCGKNYQFSGGGAEEVGDFDDEYLESWIKNIVSKSKILEFQDGGQKVFNALPVPTEKDFVCRISCGNKYCRSFLGFRAKCFNKEVKKFSSWAHVGIATICYRCGVLNIVNNFQL